MKHFAYLLILVSCWSCSQKPKQTETDILFTSNIPDLCYFNINNLIKGRSIYLTRISDTIFIYKYDTLGRQVWYNYTKAFARKEHTCYFDRTFFPIYKSIQVDYSLWYNGSLVKLNKDTIKTYWYHEFGDIQDTAIYIFENNKIKEIEIPPLNDHDRQKMKKTFIYNGNKIDKIVTVPLYGDSFDGYGKLDSSIALFKYTEKIVIQIDERFYYHNKNDNHISSYFFDNSGFPVRYNLRDTISFNIKIANTKL